MILTPGSASNWLYELQQYWGVSFLLSLFFQKAVFIPLEEIPPFPRLSFYKEKKSIKKLPFRLTKTLVTLPFRLLTKHW